MVLSGSSQDDGRKLTAAEKRLLGLMLQKLTIRMCQEGKLPELAFDNTQKQARKGAFFDTSIPGCKSLKRVLIDYAIARHPQGLSPEGSIYLCELVVDAKSIPSIISARDDLTFFDMRRVSTEYEEYDLDVVGVVETQPELNAKITEACAEAGYPNIQEVDWNLWRK